MSQLKERNFLLLNDQNYLIKKTLTHLLRFDIIIFQEFRNTSRLLILVSIIAF